MIDRLDLNAYIDGELNESERKVVEKAIAESDTLRKEVQSMRDLKAFMSREIKPIDSPAAWKASMKRLDEIDRSRRVETFVGRYAWALCAGVAALLIGGSFLSDRAGSRAAEKGAFARNVASLQGTPSAGGTKQADAKLKNTMENARRALQGMPVLDEKINWAPVGQIATFWLRDAEGDMKLEMVTGPMAPQGLTPIKTAPGYFEGSMNGINYVVWLSGNATEPTTFMLSGQRDVEKLLVIAKTNGLPAVTK